MSNNLRDLYQQLIIDHSKHPRNCCICEHANHKQDGNNPLCGDRLTLYVDEENGVIADICFQGQGCAIAMASASLMTEAVKGKTVAEALQLFAKFQQLVTGAATPVATDHDQGQQGGLDLGKLEVFVGVKEFPIRVKCATLPWHTLKAALAGEKIEVTTEK